MRSGLFLSVAAVGLALAIPAMSSEIIGGGETSTKWVAGVPYTTGHREWRYEAPVVTIPDNFHRPPTRGAGTRQDAGFSKSNEDRKKAIRDASGYRDPPGTRELR